MSTRTAATSQSTTADDGSQLAQNRPNLPAAEPGAAVIARDAIGPRQPSRAVKTGETPARMDDGAGYRVETLTTRSAILAVEEDWKALEAVSVGSAVFQAFDVCFPWLDLYVFGEAPTHSAHVLAFYSGDRLVALAPLAQKLGGWTSVAEWVGDPLVQYGDILMDPSCDREALRDALTRQIADWGISGLHLRKVRADSRLCQVMPLAAVQMGEAEQAGIADFTAFEDAEAYFATFSKRSRQNRRKKRKTLAKRGDLTHEVVVAGPQAQLLCDLSLDWKRTWLAERGLSSRAFMDKRALTALRGIIGRARDTNPIRLFVLRQNGVPIAIEIGFVGPQGNAAFIGSYDPALDALSAGKVQMESTVLHGFKAGWKGYDMLAPLNSYKTSWSTRTVNVADYMIACDLRGVAYRDSWLRGVRPVLKAIWDRMPNRLRGMAVHQAQATPETRGQSGRSADASSHQESRFGLSHGSLRSCGLTALK